MMRVNLGCGQTPTKGWQNCDNSPTLRLAKVPMLPKLLYKCGLLELSQYQFGAFARGETIRYADATKRLPFADESCEVLYSSHMLEHLDEAEAEGFLSEALRILSSGGIIRLAVPDIRKQAETYLRDGDADAFIRRTYLCVPRPRTVPQKLRMLIAGPRHHQWMYDGDSLCRLLRSRGPRRTGENRQFLDGANPAISGR